MAACGRNLNNEFVARELVAEQSLENLYAFSDRLHEVAKRIGLASDDRPRGG